MDHTQNSSDGLEALAVQLENSGQFKVLRRLIPRAAFNSDSGVLPSKVGVVLDVETTGLDIAQDEIIELGMLKFEYSLDGVILRVIDRFESLREPSILLSTYVQKLTGIHSESLRGKRIDPAVVTNFIEDASLVVAHNAAFDRPFCEREYPAFAGKAWACSMTEVDWFEEGFHGVSLKSLLEDYRLFYESHRAIEDCQALLELMAKVLPNSRKGAFERLLNVARIPVVRVWAEGALYEQKDFLKARGYKWSDGSNGGLRAWWIDVREEELARELEFLAATVKPISGSFVRFPTKRITAFERFSNRAFLPD
ncbi:DNA polymerase-3 subunit epsilon [Bradyrhizobium sp. cir1]|uniref:3'-5' exonuclease n=1 Tax=Bradyrhizobium sp. cir1 TaxID=1445730 RepID=UPI001605BB5D|nr:3'-5' exonuclease [Bradyrhizobium sp. cir1]MBB4369923.1 DNA polymerase-3 subunit epsilon [Bradyrhizobium sp. cir1]